MTATEFEYDGIKSSVYGLYICRFDGTTDGTFPIGSEITVNTVKSPKRNQFIHMASVYENPLTFTFQVMKYDCATGAEEITARELARIMRWLIRTDNYHYLRFEQSGWDNVFYNCYLRIQKYEIGGRIFGLEIEATCDAPWGYSELKQQNAVLKAGDSFDLYNYSDEDGLLLPDLVKVKLNQTYTEPDKTYTLKLINTFFVKKDENNPKIITTTVDGCKKGEILQFDKHKNIYSSEPHDTCGLANDFNHEFLQLCSDFYNAKNTISANVDCEISISYREIRKGVC